MKIESAYQAVVARFGPAYKKDYGWAAATLGNQNPNFSDIEQNVNLEHMRPYYRLASHNVHANPKGITFKLGLPPGSELLLAGASNAGLADPGHATALSLHLLTVTLVTTNPDMDSLVTCEVMQKLVIKAGEAFMTAHSSIAI